MKITCILTVLTILAAPGIQAQSPQQNIALFDDDWRFYRGAAQSAEAPAFDDAYWRQLELPHDWSIENLPGTSSPFSKGAVSQANGGFTNGGTGWYRKHFTVPAADSSKKFYLQFDGIYMNATCWLNGKKLGRHPYGYTSFWFDISGKLKFGEENILAVEVKNEGENSRWYAGSGIYRHVWLRTTAPVHIAPWGTVVTTPRVTPGSATVHTGTRVVNNSRTAKKVTLITRITDKSGTAITAITSEQFIPKDSTVTISQQAVINAPLRWSVDTPNLYKAVSEISVDGQVQDIYHTSFGIRSLTVDAVNGFRLNGKTLKLKGGCVHHDNGPLGAKAYDRAEERKVALLKASGYNAIRCSHNPPSPAFLDACDRLGMLVIDEAFDTWGDGKNQFDYNVYFKDWWQRDIESMVLRDRNHPSIIMWSIGNEIPHREKPEVAAVAKMLANYIRKLDNTRSVTAGVNGVEPNKDAFFAALDVAGYNYAPDKYVPDHARLPKRTMIATESFPLTAFDYWMQVEDHPYVLGDFVWTAFDYIGEASIGWLGYPQSQNFFPWNLAYCGDIDVCGWKRPQSYYRDALWKKDQLSLFVTPPVPSFDTAGEKETWSHWEWNDVVADWNWHGYENTPLTVHAYASCDSVELFFNERSLGKKQTARQTKFTAAWQVPYQPGKLTAVGYTNGHKVNTAMLQTAGRPSRLKLIADRDTLKAGTQDLAYITAELTDTSGIRDPKAAELVSFDIKGPATLAAVGNANPRSLESMQQPQRMTWQGRCLLIVKTGKENGDVVITAKARGAKPVSLTIHVSN